MINSLTKYLLVTVPINGNRIEVFGNGWTGKEIIYHNGKEVSSKRSYRFECTHAFYATEKNENPRYQVTLRVSPLSRRVRYRVTRNGVLVAEGRTTDGLVEVSSRGVLWDVRGSAKNAGALYILDAFVLGAPMITGWVLLALVFGFIPRAIAGYKDREQFKRRATKVAIYVLMICLSYGTWGLNEQIARHRADDLIAACKEYKAKHQRFPDKLEDLVPEFVQEIPVAKYSLLMNHYFYPVSTRQHILMYVQVPPFGRALYTLEEGRWDYLD